LQLLSTDLYGNAFGINDSGNAVGDFTNIHNDPLSAEEWLNDSGSTVNLPGLAGSPYGGAAAAINNSGTIVGSAYTSTGGFEAVTYSPSAPAQPLPAPIGSTGTEALALSQHNGYIVGDAILSNGTYAAAQFGPGSASATLPDLSGTNNCSAAGVNSSGMAVGNCYTAGQTNSTAVLWQSGAATNLNSLIAANTGWVLEQATGVNDIGQISGFGTYNGNVNAFTLTPAPAAGLSPILNGKGGVGDALRGVSGLIAQLVAGLGNPLHFTVK
jgi:hypothetical protein